MWILLQAHGLHAVQEIVDCQAMKAQKRVRDISDGLDTRRVGSTIRDFEAVGE